MKIFFLLILFLVSFFKLSAITCSANDDSIFLSINIYEGRFERAEIKTDNIIFFNNMCKISFNNYEAKKIDASFSNSSLLITIDNDSIWLLNTDLYFSASEKYLEKDTLFVFGFLNKKNINFSEIRFNNNLYNDLSTSENTKTEGNGKKRRKNLFIVYHENFLIWEEKAEIIH